MKNYYNNNDNIDDNDANNDTVDDNDANNDNTNTRRKTTLQNGI